jgi:hypothetical protein
VREFQLFDTHRLIPAKNSESGTVLSRLFEDEDRLHELVELDGATNTRLLGEEGLLPGIGVHELVYGIRYAHIVNAAFTHAAPDGARFSGPDRGAWYAGLERETSAAEVAFHKIQQLEEIGWPDEEAGIYDEYLADFSAPLHELDASSQRSRKYLQPAPIPDCYREPQRLAAELLEEQSNGIVYPSVRRAGGTCVVCFRPALVYNVRRDARFELRLAAGRSFSPRQMRRVRSNE